jgi:hypothetical protein
MTAWAASADQAAQAPPALSPGKASFRIVHSRPSGLIESQWRNCLADCDFPTHYTSPEFFLEPMLRKTNGFAVLSLMDEQVTGILTGTHDGYRVQSGLSVRPQIAFSRHADRSGAMASLIAGLVVEAASAKLVDLFVWSDIEVLVKSRFRRRPYEGVVMLDLLRGPDALFRKFSANKRINIKKAIKYGVSVAPAKSVDEISAYYRICVDWCFRKNLPIQSEDEFQENFKLSKNRLLLLARHEGRIIAGVVIRFFPGGVMEYAANSSLQSALHLRPNDLLHWRAIEWGYREGLTKYSLGGAHLFLRKFGGQIVPTTRCRLDMSMFRGYTVRDWLGERIERIRMSLPEGVLAAGRSWRHQMSIRIPAGRRSTN